MREKEAFDFPYRNVSCYGYCFWEISKFHSRDPMNDLFCPWGSSFESDLIFRDWWLIDYLEKYTNTSFIKGKWKEVEGLENIKREIQQVLKEGRIVMFQTEWSDLDFHPHYRKRKYNTHSALITSYHQNKFVIKDRMLISNLHKPSCLVEESKLKEAFSNKFLVFDYSFAEKEDKVNTLKRWIESSKSEMEKMHSLSQCFSPHLRIVEGIQYINLFRESLKQYPKEYRMDKHFVDLLTIRLIDCLEHHIISNRFISLTFLNENYKDDMILNTVKNLLKQEIVYFEQLKISLGKMDMAKVEKVSSSLYSKEIELHKELCRISERI